MSFVTAKFLSVQYICKIELNMFNFQFRDPLSYFSVGYKNESNNDNDSKKEDLIQLFDI